MGGELGTTNRQSDIISVKLVLNVSAVPWWGPQVLQQGLGRNRQGRNVNTIKAKCHFTVLAGQSELAADWDRVNFRNMPYSAVNEARNTDPNVCHSCVVLRSGELRREAQISHTSKCPASNFPIVSTNDLDCGYMLDKLSILNESYI